MTLVSQEVKFRQMGLRDSYTDWQKFRQMGLRDSYTDWQEL